MDLWIVGQHTGGLWDEKDKKWFRCTWEFQGVFDDKQKAIDACINKNYWVAPITLNEKIPHETSDFKDFFYPIQESD